MKAMSGVNQLYKPTSSVQVGPKHSDLNDFINQDPTEYVARPLVDETLRRMIASAAFSVLPLAHQYDRIVGEDTSGRYPALIVGAAINRVREHAGLLPAERSFLSGRVPYKAQPDWQYLADEKMLVVTEFIAGGASTARILEALGSKVLEMPDFLTVDGNPQSCASITKGTLLNGGGRIFSGDLSYIDGYADDHLCGVTSNSWKAITKNLGHAHAAVAPCDVDDLYYFGTERQAVVASRREAAAFGKHIAKYYLANKTIK